MKIFIWGKWIDDIFGGTKPPDGIGGAEVQMAYWSKYLAGLNHKVSTFSWRKKFYFKKHNNVFFMPLPWIRKIGILLNPLKYIYLIAVNPNLIILRSSNDLDILLFYRKILKFKLVFMLAHDFNVMKDKTDSLFGRNWFLRLNKCDIVIAQNKFQSDALTREFEDDTKIILQPNIFVPLFEMDYNIEIKIDFLWVGNIKPIKRPDWFVRLAERFPQYSFGIIGQNQDDDLYKMISQKVNSLKNLEYFGYLSFDETLKYISIAKVLINTSEFEGFPNVLIQAWYYNKPVISTVNPDNVFNKFSLGYLVNNEDELGEKADILLNQSEIYNEFTIPIKNYFNYYHNPENAFNKLLSKITY